ncbi:MAG: hypothetical protein GYB68_11555 [Chloroflexi bacterium]|nr:hypothetical protein [Chloroflexota bacterium]
MLNTIRSLVGVCTIAVLLVVGCSSPNIETVATSTPSVLLATPTGGTAGPTPTAIAAAPTPTSCDGQIVSQPFERGHMFWVARAAEQRCDAQHSFAPGTGSIWVLFYEDDSKSEGEWLSFVDDWDDATEPVSDPSLVAPAELLQPVNGFGKVWREKLTDDERQQLGWATWREEVFVTSYRYEPGFSETEADEFVVQPGQHVLETLAGERYFLDESSQTFDYIPAGN